MEVKNGEFVWFNGEFVPWDAAKIHVATHALHYGSCLFEGIRCYETEDGPAVLRLPEGAEDVNEIDCQVSKMITTLLEMIAKDQKLVGGKPDVAQAQ